MRWEMLWVRIKCCAKGVWNKPVIYSKWSYFKHCNLKNKQKLSSHLDGLTHQFRLKSGLCMKILSCEPFLYECILNKMDYLNKSLARDWAAWNINTKH